MKKDVFIFLVILLSFGCCTLQSTSSPNLPYKSFVQIQAGEKLGSGTVVKNTAFGGYVLTAEHVCRGESEADIATLNREVFRGKIIKKHKGDDLCLIFVDKLDLPHVQMADSSPQIGDYIYSISAPRGFTGEGYVPVTLGVYSGQKNGEDIYSMPISFGSSGGMVVNQQGELIGVTNKIRRFPLGLGADPYDQITIGTSLKDVRVFLEFNLRSLSL